MRTAALATLLCVLVTCAPEPPSDPRPLVVVSVAPQAYVVERIAGDLVAVRIMIPAGAGPHTYEPTIKDLAAVADAKVYVKVGHPKFTFEQAWLDALIRDRPDLHVIDSSQGIDSDAGDPHVWVAPSQVRATARNVAQALAALLPQGRAVFAARLASFERELDQLDTDIRRVLAERPGKRFFVFHPAWGYFAHEYGLVQVAIEREGREPDPSTLAAMIEEARAAQVRVIFVQPQHSDASARLVAEAIGARTDTLDPLARDWTKNLREAAGKIAAGLVP